MSDTAFPLAHEFRRRVVLPVAGMVLFAFFLAGGLLYEVSLSQDQRARDQSERIVQSAIETRQQTLARTLKDYAAWGSAYENLHKTVNAEWAYTQENVGATLYTSFTIDYILLFDPKGGTVYSVVRGVRQALPADERLAGGLDKLIERARQVGPNETKVVTGVLDVGGEPIVAAAAALSTGGDPTVTPSDGPPSILVFGDRLTAAKLGQFGAGLFVQGMHVTAEPATAGDATLILNTADAAGALTLAWRPDQPGREMLVAVLPWLLLAGCGLGIFVVLVMRHATRAAKAITQSTAELAEAHAQAEHRALHDGTTGLPNRTSLTRYLETALATGGRVAVFCLDLDRFKPINDVLGHAAGDHVLAETGHRLLRAVREGDLAARVGGDEFVIVARDIADDDIEALCKRILRDVTAPIVWEASEVSVGVSIGIALAPTDGRTMQELLSRADVALYQAKNDGRGTWRFFAAEMNERILGRRSLELDLRRAVQNSEFTLVYQPRYDARSMRIIAVEALLRWRHPERGLIEPAAFISLAEETGLIVPIGEWVLRQACLDMSVHKDVRVSVNVSPAQFRAVDFAATLSRILTETGFEPGRLELELTEGVLLEDTKRAIAILAGLKDLGVRLAMDDFGTGYSSLGYLRTFPFDAIKIDQSFVAGLASSGNARAIVQAILVLGRSLGMDVTAEGVETAEQLMLLRLDACEEVQGFYMAKPMPVKALHEVIAASVEAPAEDPPELRFALG